MDETIRKLSQIKTMPELDVMREEVAKTMMSGGEEVFHKVQDAFRKAKNRLQRVPLRDRTW